MGALKKSSGAAGYAGSPQRGQQRKAKVPFITDITETRKVFEKESDSVVSQRKKVKIISDNNHSESKILADDFTVEKHKPKEEKKRLPRRGSSKINKGDKDYAVVEEIQADDELSDDNHQERRQADQCRIGRKYSAKSSYEEIKLIGELESNFFPQLKEQSVEYEVSMLKNSKTIKVRYKESPLLNLVAKIKCFVHESSLGNRSFGLLNLLGLRISESEKLVIELRKDLKKIQDGFETDLEKRFDDKKLQSELSLRSIAHEIDEKSFSSVKNYLEAVSAKILEKREEFKKAACKTKSLDKLLDLSIKQELMIINYEGLVRTSKASNDLKSIREAKALLKTNSARSLEVLSQSKGIFLNAVSRFALKSIFKQVNPELAAGYRLLLDSKVGSEILKDRVKNFYTKMKNFFANIFYKVFGKKGQEAVSEPKKDALITGEKIDSIVEATTDKVTDEVADSVSRALASVVQQGTETLHGLLGNVNKGTEKLIEAAQGNLKELGKESADPKTILDIKNAISRSLRMQQAV